MEVLDLLGTVEQTTKAALNAPTISNPRSYGRLYVSKNLKLAERTESFYRWGLPFWGPYMRDPTILGLYQIKGP